MLRSGVVALLAAGFAACALLGEADRTQFHIKDERLHRGDWPVQVVAIETPALGRTGVPYDELARTMNRVARYGGNAVVAGIPGISEDGRAISEAGREAIAHLLEAGEYRRMGVVFRVIPPGTPDDPALRRRIVDTVSRELPREWRAIYWVDGPGAGPLAQRFHEQAPWLTTLAEGGLHLTPQDTPPVEANPLAVVVGATPPLGDDWTHCILPPDEGSYTTLAAWRNPADGEPALPEGPVAPGVLTEEERAEGFIALFDGYTLDGWIPTGPWPDFWAVEDHALVLKRAGGGYLRSRAAFSDFILRLEWRIVQGGNSGIFVRMPLAGRQSRIGMEFQVMGDHGRPPHRNGTGAIYGIAAPRVNASRPAGEWNAMEIAIVEGHLRATLNGELIHDIDVEKHPELSVRNPAGFFGLQDHGHHVAYRNIRLKPMGETP
jgi:hypothetical protein